MIVHLTFLNQGDKRKKNLIVASIKKNIKIENREKAKNIIYLKPPN